MAGTVRCRYLIFAAAMATLTLAAASPASAEWTVAKASGTVLKLDGDRWTEIEGGEIVPDNRILRTLPSGRVLLHQDGDTISLAGHTAVQFKLPANGAPLTILQYSGAVSIDAKNANRARYVVETPVLQAVGDGSAFTVEFNGQQVTVRAQGGDVLVSDLLRRHQAMLGAGQQVTASSHVAMKADGSGAAAVIVDAAGQPVAGLSGGSNPQAGSGGNQGGQGQGGGNQGGQGQGGGNQGGQGQGGGNEGGKGQGGGNQGGQGQGGDNQGGSGGAAAESGSGEGEPDD
jgi:hypothetical protein